MATRHEVSGKTDARDDFVGGAIMWLCTKMKRGRSGAEWSGVTHFSFRGYKQQEPTIKANERLLK